MPRYMTSVMLALSAFPLAAMAVAAYGVTAGGLQFRMMAGSILLLSCCLTAGIAVISVMLSRHEAWLGAQQDALEAIAVEAEAALTRSTAAEQRAAQAATTTETQAIASDVGALRRDFHEMLTGRARHSAFAEPAAAAKPAFPAQAKPAPRNEAAAATPPRAAEGREHLTLLLEPVVELASGATSHYRALVGLTDARGEMVGHDDLMQKAEQGGMRPALDLRMLRMVAPVLRRLRNRNRAIRIFVPVGQATLLSGTDAGQMLALLKREADVADGLVLEFAQHDLGKLDTAGVDNLAALARAGATLALRDIYLGGLDLGALRQLGVRFLSFPPHAVDAGSGPTKAWTEFAAQARELQMQLVVGNVRTPQQATAVSRLARFGHGPFFAPPRRVRPEAGVGAAPAAAAPSRARVA